MYNATKITAIVMGISIMAASQYEDTHQPRLYIITGKSGAIGMFTQHWNSKATPPKWREIKAVMGNSKYVVTSGVAYVVHDGHLYRHFPDMSGEEGAYQHWNGQAWETINEASFSVFYKGKGKGKQRYYLKEYAIGGESSSLELGLSNDGALDINGIMKLILTEQPLMLLDEASSPALPAVVFNTEEEPVVKLTGTGVEHIVRLINAAWDISPSSSQADTYTLKYTDKEQLQRLLAHCNLDKKISTERYSRTAVANFQAMYKIHLSTADLSIFPKVLTWYRRVSGKPDKGKKTLFMHCAHYLNESDFLTLLNTDFAGTINEEIEKQDSLGDSALYYVVRYQTDAAVSAIISYIDSAVLKRLLLQYNKPASKTVEKELAMVRVVRSIKRLPFSVLLKKLGIETCLHYLQYESGLLFRIILSKKPKHFLGEVFVMLSRLDLKSSQQDSKPLSAEDFLKGDVKLGGKAYQAFIRLMHTEAFYGGSVLVVASLPRYTKDKEVLPLLLSLMSDELLHKQLVIEDTLERTALHFAVVFLTGTQLIKLIPRLPSALFTDRIVNFKNPIDNLNLLQLAAAVNTEETCRHLWKKIDFAVLTKIDASTFNYVYQKHSAFLTFLTDSFAKRRGGSITLPLLETMIDKLLLKSNHTEAALTLFALYCLKNTATTKNFKQSEKTIKLLDKVNDALSNHPNVIFTVRKSLRAVGASDQQAPGSKGFFASHNVNFNYDDDSGSDSENLFSL